MGFYREQVLPRLVDRACRSSSLDRWRAEVTEGLTGRVVEVGFGSGLNADYYPAEVELVLAVEPAAVARKLAEKRISRSAVAVEHVGMDGQSILSMTTAVTAPYRPLPCAPFPTFAKR